MRARLFLDGELREGGSVDASPLGRGFAYGYGAFETIKFRDGRACFFSEHLERLRKTVAKLGLTAPLDAASLREQAVRLFADAGASDGVFKIVVYDDGGRGRVALFVRELGAPGPRAPLRLLLSPVVKASRAFTSRHKTLNYLETIRELEAARGRGFDECLYRNEFGFLTECSVSNFFFIVDGALRTPRLECGLLDGILRRQTIEAARELGWRVEEDSFPFEALAEAQEAFVTNSAVGATPIREIDDGEGGSLRFESQATAVLAEALQRREAEALERG